MCVSVGPSVWSRPPDSPSPFLPPGWKAISLPHSDRPHYWDNLLATGLDLTRCHPASASEHCSPDSAGLGEGGGGREREGWRAVARLPNQGQNNLREVRRTGTLAQWRPSPPRPSAVAWRASGAPVAL